MSVKSKEEVRDAYLGDLPEELRRSVMEAHKLVQNTCRALIRNENYKDLCDKPWAKTMLDEFLVTPMDKAEVGSVRVYKCGNRCRCMIQLTGHVINNRNTIDEELFHDFIRNVHGKARTRIRRDYDLTLTCESEHGEHFEGFDVWTSKKVAEEVWEKLSDCRTKTVRPMEESADGVSYADSVLSASLEELPPHLQTLIQETHSAIFERTREVLMDQKKYQLLNEFLNLKGFGSVYGGYTEESSDIGRTEIRRDAAGVYEGAITLTPTPEFRMTEEGAAVMDELFESVYDSYSEEFNAANPTKLLSVNGNRPNWYFELVLTPTYAEKLWQYLEAHKQESEKKFPKSRVSANYVKAMQKRKERDSITEEVEWDPFTEADNQTPECNTEMTPAQAKATLRQVSQNLMSSMKSDSYKVSQYTANIYANVITKNLLPLWAKGFRKFSIILDSYQSFSTVEFKVPSLTQDFVARFVEGRETINGLLHRSPEIRVKMSPRVFHSIKNPDDAFNFFRAMIKYYDTGIATYSQKLMLEIMKLNREMKHLISTSKLSGLVTCPMQMLFVFENVDMSNKDTFKIKQSDINTVNQFVRGIYSKYASPEKEKKQIVDDVRRVVEALKESVESPQDRMALLLFPESVQTYLSGGFDNEMEKERERALLENLDEAWCYHNQNPEIKYLQEFFGVKKLKKIPADLVAYVTIEAEAIRDATDKMMIASYCLNKIEIVEWYIELLEVGSKKYIVPHTKPYLESLRTQLLAAYKKIMAVKIVAPSERLIIDIKYPKGYEG